MQIPKNDPVRLLRQSCTAPFCWGTCLSRTVSRTRLTAMRFHAILCYSEGRNSRENAMSFRFFPWTKVSLILQGLRTFSADFGDKKIPRGCGDLSKRAIRLENPLLGSAVPRAVRDGIACNPYRLRYWNTNGLVGTETSLIIACNPYRLRYWNCSVHMENFR